MGRWTYFGPSQHLPTSGASLEPPRAKKTDYSENPKNTKNRKIEKRRAYSPQIRKTTYVKNPQKPPFLRFDRKGQQRGLFQKRVHAGKENELKNLQKLHSKPSPFCL
jgi:hypothetical protein